MTHFLHAVRPRLSVAAGICLMAGQLALTLLLWNGLQGHEQEHQARHVEAESRWLHQRLEAAIRERVNAIDRMAQRWDAGGGTPRPLWQRDAETYLRDLPGGFVALQWVDADDRLRWVAPDAMGETATHLHAARAHLLSSTFARARATGTPVFSSQIALAQGGQGIVLVRALSVSGRFDGYLIAVFRTTELFAHLSEEIDARGYNLEVSSAGITLYRRGTMPVDAAASNLINSFEFDNSGSVWKVRLWPTPDSSDIESTRLPELVLTSGLALTLLLAVAVWLWELSMRRARQTAVANRAQQESTQHLQAILDNVIDGIITIDERGSMISFNAAAERIFGFASGEVIGHNISMLMPEPHRSQHDGYLHNYLSTGVARVIGIGREAQGQHKDGSVFPIDLSVSQIARDGKRMFIGLVRDITARKHAEDLLVSAKEAAEHASLAKSQFLASMSHELRTPMNAVLGFAQLIEAEQALTPESRENLEEIIKAGWHLLQLINEVLDLSNIEEGKAELAIEPVGVADLVDECLIALEPLAQERQIRIERGDFDQMTVRADRKHLKQALLNLLSNAVKYNRPAGHVRVHAAIIDTGMLRLLVSDTGPGIPADRLKELLQPFNRLGLEAGSIAGTGIGLVLARRIVELMGGRIGVDSQHGTGSTFWIELPLSTSMPATLEVVDALLARTDSSDTKHL